MKKPHRPRKAVRPILKILAIILFPASQAIILNSHLIRQVPIPRTALLMYFATAVPCFVLLLLGLISEGRLAKSLRKSSAADDFFNGVGNVLRRMRDYYGSHPIVLESPGSPKRGGDDEKRTIPREALREKLEDLINRLEREGGIGGSWEDLLETIRDIEEIQVGYYEYFEEYRQGTAALRSERDDLITSVSSSLFEYESVIRIIKDLIENSEKYEAETLNGIFRKFEEIWEYSKALVEDSERTIQLFSKGSRGEKSLSYIAEKNDEVSSRFKEFTGIVEKLENNSRLLLESSVNGLASIRETAGGIEDMADRIKVISINVRIEAARESGKDSGFQVLGQEITKFAEQTARFANDTINKIEETIKSIEPLREELLKDLSQVQDDMDTVRLIMAPYKEIIAQSFVSMDKVITNLNEISVGISEKMRQTVGNMQYHDITNQEATHITEILEKTGGDCRENFGGFSMTEALDAEAKKKISKHVAAMVDSLITTGSEREVLDAFKSERDIAEAEAEHDLSGSVNLDEKTILF